MIVMSPEEHDRLIARTSHVPHLAAAMLVGLLGRSGGKADDLCGPGFRDATRIAAGSEDLWHDIVKTNRRFVGQELDALARLLARVRAMIGRGDFKGLRGFLASSRKRRNDFNVPFDPSTSLPSSQSFAVARRAGQRGTPP